MTPRTALALAALAALTACPRLDPMQRQQKVKAYQPSAHHPDGLAMRAPPEGTVPHRSLRPPEVETGLGPDGRPVALSPIRPSWELLRLGRKRYDIHCAVCHGLVGDGRSQVALNMSLRRPPDLHLYRDVPDGYLYRVIAQGFGLMPAYAADLTVEERWAVVAYVRALQISQGGSIADVPRELRPKMGVEGDE